jgi:pantothenate kinase type III
VRVATLLLRPRPTAFSLLIWSFPRLLHIFLALPFLASPPHSQNDIPLHARTPHLTEDELKFEDPIAILSRNLPDQPHDYIFGKARDASAENANEQSKLREVPQMSVYVVSTNRDQEALLARIWETVPSRFFVMKGEDFFKKEEGRYDTMGTDRLATLTGAVHMYGHPALVFDGGTATTYSATDSDGKILGGGIGPGIQSKFRSLSKDTHALPEISSEELLSRVKEAQDNGKPLPTFARNTREAMMVDSFQEFALKGRNVIEHWLEKAFRKTIPAGRAKVNTKRKVLCTGGDGDILMELLQPHHGGLIEHINSDGGKYNNESSKPRYDVESSKHLMHYGVACALLSQNSLRKRKRLPREEYIGKRVAKHFEVEADDGDNIFRGIVARVIEFEGEDPDFRIQYDDGDSEDVAMDELLGEYLPLSLMHNL